MCVHHALRRRGSGVLAALLVCGWLLALVGCAPAAATSTAPPAPYFSATDVSMDSPTDGWAVGPDGILQYMHGAWVNVTASLPPLPADWESQWPYPGLRSVAIASPTNVWAMGDGGMIWHYDGARWRMVASPYFPNRYYTSPSVDGYTASDALLAHFATDAHSVETLYASQMLSPAQGWSVGGTAFAAGSINWGPAVVEQYRGGTWQVAHVVPRDTQPSRWPVFFCLTLTSMQDGWIGGAWAHPTLVGSGDTPPVEGNPTYTPLLLHYHAGQWTFVSAPTTGAIHRLVMLSADDGWAAADGGLLRYTGGQWRLVSVHAAS